MHFSRISTVNLNAYFSKEVSTVCFCYVFIQFLLLGQEGSLGITANRQRIIYNTKKKGPAWKNLRFFLLETLKSCNSNEKFDPQMTLWHFSQNQGTFFLIPKNGRRDLVPSCSPHLVTRMLLTNLCLFKNIYFYNLYYLYLSIFILLKIPLLNSTFLWWPRSAIYKCFEKS